MRFYRFHTIEQLNDDIELVLDKAQSSHIGRVLRLRVGQEIILFNGDGFDYQGQIIDDGKIIRVHINARSQNLATPSLNIHLAQALARGDRMDYAIQKAVEMGVSEITPLITEYTQVKLDQKRLAKKLNHWQGVITAALEQSGRADKVQLNEPQSFIDWSQATTNSCVYLHPRTSNQMADVVTRFKNTPHEQIQIAIGPEGGFSDSEMSGVASDNIVAIGPRILRTETAATAVLAILQHALSG